MRDAANLPDGELHRRVFAALAVPGAVSARLLAAARAYLPNESASGIRLHWAPPENLHVTLAFLGDLRQGQLERLRETLNTLPPPRAATLSPAVLGPFPDPQGAILAAELRADMSLTLLHESVMQTAVACGLEPRQEAFRPHITLARLSHKSPVSLPPAIALEGYNFVAGEYGLWKGVHKRDEQGQDHYRYLSLASFPLCAGCLP